MYLSDFMPPFIQSHTGIITVLHPGVLVYMPVIQLLELVGLLDIHIIIPDGTIHGFTMVDIILIITTGIITRIIISGHTQQ